MNFMMFDDFFKEQYRIDIFSLFQKEEIDYIFEMEDESVWS